MGSAVTGFPVGVVADTDLERYTALVLADSPVAYWPLDDASGLPQDISGNGNHMTAVSGSPVYEQAGPFGAGSIDEAIEYPSTAFHERAAVSAATTNISVEMWVRRDGNSAGDLFRSGTTSGGFEIEFTAVGGVWRVNLPGVGALGAIDPVLANTTWTYLAVTRGASQWTGYVNDNTPDLLGTASPGAAVGNIRIIGAGATSLRVAHLAYYNTELSHTDVAARYLIASGAV